MGMFANGISVLNKFQQRAGRDMLDTVWPTNNGAILSACIKKIFSLVKIKSNILQPFFLSPSPLSF